MKENIKSVLIKISYLLFSLLISVALWTYVQITDNEVQTRNIRVADIIFRNEDLLNSRGLLVSSIVTENLEITFEGNLREMNRLVAGEVFVEVDLENVRSAGTVTLNYIEILPDNVNINNIAIKGMTATQIVLIIDRLLTQQFPIEVDYSGGTASSEFMAETPEVEPGNIDISGPEELVARISHVSVPIVDENLSTTLTGEFAYILVDEFDEEIDFSVTEWEALKFSHETIRVTIPIRQVRTLPLQVELFFGELRTVSESNTSWYADPREITVAADPEVFRNLDINSIMLGNIDMASFPLTTTRTFPILLPAGLTNLTGETTATVVVNVRELEREFRSVSNIRVVNTPLGHSATIVDQSLLVSLRGSSANLALVRPENIMVVADIAEIGTGTSRVPARASIIGIDADVDVVYPRDDVEYTIVVTITEDD